MNPIKVYLAVKMTGRYQDELLKESLMVCNALRNYGFEPLSPVIEEGIKPIHELLTQSDEQILKNNWQRDKQMLQDAHIMLDYQSCNRSDGVGVEMGLTRFNYWKPVIRVFPNVGFCISRLEFDNVTSNLSDALDMMQMLWGTKRKLLIWRLKMLFRCLPKFIWLQAQFLGDCL